MASVPFTKTATRQHLNNVWSSPRLRYFKMDHTEAAHRAAMSRNWNNPGSQATVNLSLVEPVNQTGVENRMKMFGEIAMLAVLICLPGEDDHSPGQIIGNVLLRPNNSKDLLVNRRGEIGIVIGDEFQNKGYGREAINWIMDWGFGQVGLHSIAVEAATFNEGALHLYKSIGFQEDGRARQARFFGGKWYDVVMMSMLEEEWRALRAA